MIKKLTLTAALFTLSACGFTPMHAPNMGGDSAAFKNIKVELVEHKDIAQQESGFYLQQSLMDRIGSDGTRHTLRITPKISRRGYGVTSNDVASRYDMVMTVKYELNDSVTGKNLDKGNIQSTTTFGSSRDPYARTSAEKNATEQVARDAADQIIIRLAAYYNKTAP